MATHASGAGGSARDNRGIRRRATKRPKPLLKCELLERRDLLSSQNPLATPSLPGAPSSGGSNPTVSQAPPLAAATRARRRKSPISRSSAAAHSSTMVSHTRSSARLKAITIALSMAHSRTHTTVRPMRRSIPAHTRSSRNSRATIPITPTARQLRRWSSRPPRRSSLLRAERSCSISIHIRRRRRQSASMA